MSQTPKERAIELHKTFYDLLPETLSDKKRHETAQKCAFKAAKEVLELLNILERYPKTYWQAIISEIHLL